MTRPSEREKPARDYNKRGGYVQPEPLPDRPRLARGKSDGTGNPQTHQKPYGYTIKPWIPRTTAETLRSKGRLNYPNPKLEEAIKQQEGPHRKDRYRFAASKKLIERR